MKTITFLIFFLLFFSSQAQTQKERRVYYLDCSYSMVSNKIWDKVCSNLKKAIDNVNDETTELIVIPFALDHNGGIQVIKAYATENGKKTIKDKISLIKPSKSSMTYHKIPLQDFYNNRTGSNKVTYMFLMTDGQDEWKERKIFPYMLKQWQSKFGNKNVYGFYVMLHNAARNSNIDDICNSQNHLWKVETADINVNLIRLQPNAIYNARNETYFEVPIYGNINNIDIHTEFDKSSPYYVSKTIVKNGKIKVFVKFKEDIYSLPKSKKYALHISMTGGDEYDFLVTDKIFVTCESKPERSLKVSIK